MEDGPCGADGAPALWVVVKATSQEGGSVTVPGQNMVEINVKESGYRPSSAGHYQEIVQVRHFILFFSVDCINM